MSATAPAGYATEEPTHAPPWHGLVVWDVFFNALTTGVFTVAAVGELSRPALFAPVAEWAYPLALVLLLVDLSLLVMDLGDPLRFHHMLRVFKPSTPMSLGSWILSGYSLPCTAEAIRQFTLNRLTTAQRRRFEASAINKAVTAVNDVAGVPLALGLAGYTGVLLSCASTPLWCKNNWIGPLFSSSAAATAASAVNLALDLTGADLHGPSKRAIEKIELAAHATEAAALVGFLKQAGPLARPLTHGGQKRNLWLTIIGILGAEFLKALPLHGRKKRTASILASLLSLAGGLALRWAFVYGGQESGGNPRDARLGSKPKPARDKSAAPTGTPLEAGV
jgi:formate-dependent nitrite reductase membrane component NrfD